MDMTNVGTGDVNDVDKTEVFTLLCQSAKVLTKNLDLAPKSADKGYHAIGLSFMVMTEGPFACYNLYHHLNTMGTGTNAKWTGQWFTGAAQFLSTLLGRQVGVIPDDEKAALKDDGDLKDMPGRAIAALLKVQKSTNPDFPDDRLQIAKVLGPVDPGDVLSAEILFGLEMDKLAAAAAVDGEVI